VGSGAASGACARCSGQLRVKGMWWCTPCHMRLSGRELAGMHRRCGHAAAGVRHVAQCMEGGGLHGDEGDISMSRRARGRRWR
jgi:hypothetical protein